MRIKKKYVTLNKINKYIREYRYSYLENYEYKSENSQAVQSKEIVHYNQIKVQENRYMIHKLILIVIILRTKRTALQIKNKKSKNTQNCNFNTKYISHTLLCFNDLINQKVDTCVFQK